MRRRSWVASMVVTSSPSSQMRPLVGSMSRLIIRKVVLLPLPDGPISAQTSPVTTSSDRWSTAGGPGPYRLVSASRAIIRAPYPRNGTTPDRARRFAPGAAREPAVGAVVMGAHAPARDPSRGLAAPAAHAARRRDRAADHLPARAAGARLAAARRPVDRAHRHA